MESSLIHTRLIDVQALKNQLNKSYAEPFSKNAKNTDFALKIQALFLPFFSNNRRAIRVTLKKTSAKRRYSLMVSKEKIVLKLLDPDQRMTYFFHENRALNIHDALNFKPEQLKQFSVFVNSILEDLKADQTIIEEILGDTNEH